MYIQVCIFRWPHHIPTLLKKALDFCQRHLSTCLVGSSHLYHDTSSLYHVMCARFCQCIAFFCNLCACDIDNRVCTLYQIRNLPIVIVQIYIVYSVHVHVVFVQLCWYKSTLMGIIYRARDKSGTVHDKSQAMRHDNDRTSKLVCGPVKDQMIDWKLHLFLSIAYSVISRSGTSSVSDCTRQYVYSNHNK